MNTYTYQVGGSLINNAPSYVERSADIELYQALRQGEFCYVLNCRQMGKSSLLVRTKHRLEKEGFKCSTVDMTNIGSENITPTQWYKGIVTDLWRGFKLIGKFNLKSWWQEGEDISLVQKLSYFIDELLTLFSEEQLIIFIDEIDSVLSLDFSVDDFFAVIRYCYNQRAIQPKYKRLTFAIFGVATPSDLIQDPQRTPFNLGKAIELQGFNIEEVDSLIKGFSELISHPEIIMKEIIFWTGGQPFLTQKICNLITNFKLETHAQLATLTQGNEVFWIANIIKEYLIENWESQDEPEHLRTIRDRILYNQQLAGALLGIYQQILQGIEVRNDDSKEQIELLLSGLVVKKTGFLTIKNRIYAAVFNLDWVEKQLANLRPYSQTFDAWLASQQTDDSRLLRGQALVDAQTWAWDKSLTNLDHQFLAKSAELEKKEQELILAAERAKNIEMQLNEQQKNARSQKILLVIISTAFLTAVSMGGISFWLYRQSRQSEILAKISEIKALVSSSQGRFKSHQQLESLVDAIKARREWQKLNLNYPLNHKYPELEQLTNNVLHQASYGAQEINRLSGENLSFIWDVSWSPDGEMIVIPNRDQVWLWQKNGKLLRKFTGHTSTVFTVAFSPDGTMIASGSIDNSVKFWSLDGEELANISVNAQVQTIAFSPDGKLLAIGMNDGSLGLWNLAEKKLTIIKAHQLNLYKVLFTPDGKKIVTGSFDGSAKLWSREGKKLVTFNRGEDAVRGLAISPDGKLLATGGNNKKIEIWSLDGKKINAFAGQYSVIAITFNPDGKTIAAASWDKVVKMWSLDGKDLGTLEGHEAAVWAIAWSPNGKILATGSLDSTVNFWQLQNPLFTVLQGHQLNLTSAAVSPNGKLIATTGWDYVINIWENNGKLIRSWKAHEHGITSLLFSPDGQYLASGSADQTIKIWKINGTLIATLSGHTAAVENIALSADGQILASVGFDQTLRLWKRDNQKPFSFQLQKTILAHREPVVGLSFSPDGQMLATASYDKTVRLWNREGKLLKDLIGHNGQVFDVAFSPDGKLIASLSDDLTIRLWQSNGKFIKTLVQSKSRLNRLKFSPDGKMIGVATEGEDNTVTLWNLDGKLIKKLYGHLGLVYSLTFSPDGNSIVSVSGDRTAIIWDLPKIFALNELEYACNWARNYLQNNQELSQNDSLREKTYTRNLCDN
jgi:WD40 repeat protein/organic radical activating enzyme